MANQTELTNSVQWETIFSGASRRQLESVNLPEYLMKQRWFSGKSHRIQSAKIVDWTTFSAPHSALVWVEVNLDDGASDVYFLPLGIAANEHARELQQTAPNGVVAAVGTPTKPVLLHDGILDDQTCLALLSFIENGRDLPTCHGHIRGIRGEAFKGAWEVDRNSLRVRRGSAEQSNTSVLFGDRFILKAFRRQEAGLNPDAEISQYLTEKADFHRIPPLRAPLSMSRTRMPTTRPWPCCKAWWPIRAMDGSGPWGNSPVTLSAARRRRFRKVPARNRAPHWHPAAARRRPWRALIWASISIPPPRWGAVPRSCTWRWRRALTILPLRPNH